jgi:hypothetical protein
MADTTAEDELQRSSDEFLMALEALRAMEQEKRAMESDDPRRQGLAIDIEELSLGLLGRSQYQTQLVGEAAPDGTVAPRPAHSVLDDWRDAERRLREAHVAVRRVSLESTRFQDEYRRSIAHVEADGD